MIIFGGVWATEGIVELRSSNVCKVLQAKQWLKQQCAMQPDISTYNRHATVEVTCCCAYNNSRHTFVTKDTWKAIIFM